MFVSGSVLCLEINKIIIYVDGLHTFLLKLKDASFRAMPYKHTLTCLD